MKCLQISLALSFILVWFPPEVLAQNAPTAATKAQSVPRRTNCLFVCGENCRVRYAPNTASWILRSCERECVKKNKCWNARHASPRRPTRDAKAWAATI